MNNKKITTLFILVATIALLGIVGFTIAYFTSSTDFENEFQTGLFQTEATETFTSPSNWLPGDETPKVLTITNTGNVNVKARVCISEEWTSANDDPLPLEQNGNRAAIINLANTSDWTKKGNCYEYNNVLTPNATTSSFIESVTFNPLIEADIECTTSGNTKTCESTGDGYDNATYTLTLRVETIQESAYDSYWNNRFTFVNRQFEDEISVGDEVSLGSEHFYIVSSDTSKIVLLAKYNLLVGDVVDYDYDATPKYSLNKTLTSNDIGYGLQNENAKGSVIGSSPKQYIGVVGFSGTNYWDRRFCEYTSEYNLDCPNAYMIEDGLLPEYSQNGESYFSSPSPYVYNKNLNSVAPIISYDGNMGTGVVHNNGYTIAYYVEEYTDKLKSLGAQNIVGRLLSLEEVNIIKNGDNSIMQEYLHSCSYWLGSAWGYFTLKGVHNNGYNLQSAFNNVGQLGVRPVIEIPTSELN